MTDAEVPTPVARSADALAASGDAPDVDLDVDPDTRHRRPRWLHNLAMGIGVPLAAAGLFFILVVTGVIRDTQRANYCEVYAEASAPLVPLYSEFEETLAVGDPATVLAVTVAIRGHISALDDRPSTPQIDARLVAMTAYLQRVEVAARAHDAETLADLATQLATFRFDRQAFLTGSAEYCRYR